MCSEIPPSQGGPLSDTNVPPMGARLKLSMTKDRINNLKIDPWKKTVLQAMREYGAFIGDTGSEEYFAIEADVQYKVSGDPDKWWNFGNNNWNP